MNKFNDTGAADLDGLLLKLKARHDAREQAGAIFPSDEAFKQRFFQAARAQERPRFPMIWKVAACVAVCLLSFQIVLTQFRDDSSAARVDGVAETVVDGAGAENVNLPKMLVAETNSLDADEDDNAMDGEMILASAFVEKDDVVVGDAAPAAGFAVAGAEVESAARTQIYLYLSNSLNA